ncbi:anhydro-N-acetylmuramic acid kinase [Marinicella gelatinilytica]|uniref:anhydro-N-acetylmuramic acid kinase n=1 Tax=Marinicella gelatinilytica TaxID=2996017 RepID=UPI002260912E|nr:anhydro-N-acetylmuramic acid kinase [Marinicella gelatinilytica]MCX7543916.1 anhydro-N-acetylmuramic acid kinase [Marinicella gelatinilytica]
MSGTSADGIDLALIEDKPLTLLSSDYIPFKKDLQSRVLAVIQGEALSACDMARLDADLGQAYSDAINHFVEKHQLDRTIIQAIGLHGQTVAHLPDGSVNNSIQLGHPALVASQTNIPVISDFRRTDMVYGGQGAPLAPALHQALFKQSNQNIGVLNLGGIANLTLIGEQLIGFDVGPANCLLDEWCQLHTGHAYDYEGQWAKTGQVNTNLLHAFLQDPYFLKQPPKSTGREYFNQRWLNAYIRAMKVLPEDVQRTLLILVAESVKQAITDSQISLDQLIVVGGGSHNVLLMVTLQEKLDCTVMTSEALSISPDDIEAMLMAWLAARHCRGQKTNLKTVTGCQKPHIYGIRYGVG